MSVLFSPIVFPGACLECLVHPNVAIFGPCLLRNVPAYVILDLYDGLSTPQICVTFLFWTPSYPTLQVCGKEKLYLHPRSMKQEHKFCVYYLVLSYRCVEECSHTFTQTTWGRQEYRHCLLSTSPTYFAGVWRNDTRPSTRCHGAGTQAVFVDNTFPSYFAGVRGRKAVPTPRQTGAGSQALSAAQHGPVPLHQEDGWTGVQSGLWGAAAGRFCPFACQGDLH